MYPEKHHQMLTAEKSWHLATMIRSFGLLLLRNLDLLRFDLSQAERQLTPTDLVMIRHRQFFLRLQLELFPTQLSSQSFDIELYL